MEWIPTRKREKERVPDETVKNIVRRIAKHYASDQELSTEDALLFDRALSLLEKRQFYPVRKSDGKLSFPRNPNRGNEQTWHQYGRNVATKFIEERRDGTQGWEQLLVSINEQEQIARNHQQALQDLEQGSKGRTWDDILRWHESRYTLQRELTYATAMAHRYERESAKY